MYLKNVHNFIYKDKIYVTSEMDNGCGIFNDYKIYCVCVVLVADKNNLSV